MNILVINAHWYNRGDEAAIRAMLREIKVSVKDCEIRIQAALPQMQPEERHIEGAKVIECYPCGRKQIIESMLFAMSFGVISASNQLKAFVENVKWADLILHAPGGPSISDTYGGDELKYLSRFAIAKAVKTPYVFYAPSMGPFGQGWKNHLRKYLLNSAECIMVREAISKEYLKTLKLNKDVAVTLDSAFQTPIDEQYYLEELKQDKELFEFMSTDKKVVGITITPLSGNPAYASNKNLRNEILECFSKFVSTLNEDGFRVLFIPQLFGKTNDYNYMSECAANHEAYVVKPTHDSFFQQFIIGQLHMVFGMRYHSNVFSAKMGTPFVSISYEQKMKGLMEILEFNDLCLDIHELSYEKLVEKYHYLAQNYDMYYVKLNEKKLWLRDKSHQSTDRVVEIAGEKIKGDNKN